MLAAVALVPDTVLLLPGAAGRGPDDPELVALRAAARTAVARAVGRTARVLVVAPGPVDRSVAGTVRAGAAAAGVPDHLLEHPVPQVRLEVAPGGPPEVPGPPGTGAAAGVRLALEAGVPARGLHVVEVTPGRAAPLRAIGAATTTTGPTVLVVVGSGAARHGHDAPLPHDDRAAGLDRGLLAALHAGGTPARDALAALDAALAADLGVTGWAPWQVLVGALDAAVTAPPAPDVLHTTLWHGAAHAVVAWEVAP
ncbi:hypothetical protein H9657_17550 [Cellulomonas sp. Sa3CUA2]|uniref:Extradiol ring-cleavage dioxygenase class III enzyme subunit B domain-containing protein n=1 Tax=Cellulomonas avistercoris TaxID=2762242 RepID=A0ABR8QI60_9CELL|nr:hypothetical protein [Cellulomonas avistercoris]MBD7920080.1 hypothetical protein [Cellulomonas avistercoris]